MCIIALAFIFWPSETEELEIKKPDIVMVLELNENGLEKWSALRDNPEERKVFSSENAQVFCQGKGEAVWIFNWLWLEKGRNAAFAYLDWLAEDDPDSDATGWLKSHGYDTLGAIRGWNEVEGKRLDAEFGYAGKLALSLDGEEGLAMFRDGKRQ